MHYFKRNIGDYHKKAGRLTMLQHGAYTLLIDACYDREKFPTLENAIDWCWASTQEEILAVEFVLKKFFKVNDAGKYVQKRIEQEVQEYQALCISNSINGKKGGRPKGSIKANKTQSVNNKTQSVNLESENNPNESLNHKPLTNNHKPNKKCQKYKYSDDEYASAVFIDNKIKQITSSTKKTNLESWANELRLMKEVDGRQSREIGELFVWANSHHFWQANILSPSKLRQKWDQLKLQKDRENEKGIRNGYDNRSRAKRVSDKLDEIAKKDIEENGFTEFLDSGNF